MTVDLCRLVSFCSRSSQIFFLNNLFQSQYLTIYTSTLTFVVSLQHLHQILQGKSEDFNSGVCFVWCFFISLLKLQWPLKKVIFRRAEILVLLIVSYYYYVYACYLFYRDAVWDWERSFLDVENGGCHWTLQHTRPFYVCIGSIETTDWFLVYTNRDNKHLCQKIFT